MNEASASPLRRFTDKLFGGLKMSWLTVILFAVGSAIVTTVFLVVPVFLNTSFITMGETFEAWIFFAVIIMTNCKKPLESALKTFVFFLISQPLIYLFQVPFSWMGWALFGYYKYWFIITLLTFPAAFAGWFIKKRNWLSAVIILPILCYLAVTLMNGTITLLKSLPFPRYLVLVLFCLAQIVLYIYAFCGNLIQKLVAVLVPAALIVVLLIIQPQVQIGLSAPLPDVEKLSPSAVVELADDSIGTAQITDFDIAQVNVQCVKYGETEMVVRDGPKEYRYTLSSYYDKENNVSRVEITEK